MAANGSREITRRTLLKKTAKAAIALTAAGSLPMLFSEKASASTYGGFDIIIKGGSIYDGTVSPPQIADIGISSGRIVAIGDLPPVAGRVIEARGLAVTPGFIDVHAHCDASFSGMDPSDVSQELKTNHNLLFQCVTTVVTGNCGVGIADTDYWLGMVKAMPFGSNVLHLIPHGAVRVGLFGENQPGELSPAQLKIMERCIAEEMEKGAAGISTGLEYAPGYLSSTRELIALSKVVARYGGLYVTHVRDQSGKISGDGKPGIIASIEEVIKIGRKAGIPIEISHLMIKKPINGVPVSRVLAIIEEVRKEGLEIHADYFPYDSGCTPITQLIPNKFKANDGGIKAEFKSEKGKREIRDAIEEAFADVPSDKTLISSYPIDPRLEGKTLKEAAEIKGQSPSECFVEMVTGYIPPIGISFSMEMAQVNEFASRPDIITASDGLTVARGVGKPHPRCYGAFPRKLRSVIDSKVMTLPEAIRTMTSLPAEKFRIRNRGKIAKGYHADITILDLKEIGERATYADPHQYPSGVRHVFVNGVPSIVDGQITDNRGGIALRR